MLRIERNGLVFYQSDWLSRNPNIVAAVTTRHGGASAPPYNSLNLGSQVGDAPENVRVNWQRFHQALQLDPRSTVDARQAQANHVARVTADQGGTTIPGADALVTDDPGTTLLLRFADCVPIFFSDPAHRAIGIAHAGWRGTVGRVVANTVKTMTAEFGSRPSDLIAVIGPSIGPCCYAVGTDVQEHVLRTFPWGSDLLVRHNGSVHLDLWEANARQLRELGVEKIEVGALCTSDRTDEWYSWRKEAGMTGRFAAVIALTC